MDCSRHLPSLRPNLRSSCPSGECRIALAMDSTGKVAKSSPQLPPQAASAAQIAAVLGNDDLLREILLRVDFPNYLVRAATVSKRWLRHASDPAFLRRFRRLHPPRLLGFYLDTSSLHMCYASLLHLYPPPPELAAVIHRGKFTGFVKDARDMSDCRNGRIIIYMKPDNGIPSAAVYRPLQPERGALALPLPLISALVLDCFRLYFHGLLFRDDGGDDDMAISVVTVMGNERQVRVRLEDFQAGEWGECRNSDIIQLSGPSIGFRHPPLLAYGRIYMICMAHYILGLDAQSMSSFSIKLPNGVEYVTQDEYDTNIALSRAEDSGFCLIHATTLQICVWRYTVDHSNTGNWELIDTISLRQVFGPNADPTWYSQGADVRVVAVGDNAEFVFLRVQKKVFCLHISSRTVERVFGLSQDASLFRVSPFVMVWPPTFPTLNDGHDNDE